MLLTFAFWTCGLAKFIDFGGNAAIMEGFGAHARLAVQQGQVLQIGASLMIIFERGTWLAIGALAVFSVLTIPVAVLGQCGRRSLSRHDG